MEFLWMFCCQWMAVTIPSEVKIHPHWFCILLFQKSLTSMINAILVVKVDVSGYIPARTCIIIMVSSKCFLADGTSSNTFTMNGNRNSICLVAEMVVLVAVFVFVVLVLWAVRPVHHRGRSTAEWMNEAVKAIIRQLLSVPSYVALHYNSYTVSYYNYIQLQQQPQQPQSVSSISSKQYSAWPSRQANLTKQAASRRLPSAVNIKQWP